MVSFVIIGGIMGVVSGQRRFAQAKNRIEAALISKGMTLVVNNSVALRSLSEENAYTAIREIVATTVRRDSEMIYGIYMDNNRQPWVMTSSENPEGDVQGPNVLSDPVSNWSNNLKKPGYRLVDEAPNKNEAIMEFAAPVISSDGNKLGVIRYGISTARTKAAVLEERHSSIIEGIIFVCIFFAVAGLIFLVGLQNARLQADTITAPIDTLVKAANAISQGNYSKPVAIVSDDEIGNLAEDFDAMRLQVKGYTENLEKLVDDRTKELKSVQKELIEKAHKAGMADIASGTLHNVGNLLNSVKASIEAISAILSNSPGEDLVKANALLRENMESLDQFISRDTRGKKLMQYYLKLEVPLKEALDSITANVLRLSEKVNAINDVVAAQQSYASMGGLSEKVVLTDIIEDALNLQSGSIARHRITVEREYGEVQEVTIQKAKLVHVFVNLISNAKDAMLDTPPEKRALTIAVRDGSDAVIVKFTDTGCGIPPENITKIFSHGFTTKKNGHGYGLHSSANYMKEMGGKLWAESGDPGKGSCFICKLMKNEAAAS
jgi:signal transduction histidine kinase